MNVLVTGGSGFIGSNIVRRSIELGHEVVVLDDVSSGYRENLDPARRVRRGRRARQGRGRRRDARLRRRAAPRRERRKRPVDRDPITDSDINVMGTLNVLEAARAEGIARVVFSSSAGIFGELKTLPIAEDHPTDPDSPYGTSKLCRREDVPRLQQALGHEERLPQVLQRVRPRQRFDAYGNCIPIFADRILHRPGDHDLRRRRADARFRARARRRARELRRGASRRRGRGPVQHRQRHADLDQRARPTSCSEASGREVVCSMRRRARATCATASPPTAAAHAAFGYEPSVELEPGLAEYLAWIATDPVTARQLAEAPR